MIRRPQLTDQYLEGLRQLLPDGIHSFIVVEAKLGKTKNGNEAVNLHIQTWDDSGKEYYIYDNLVFIEKMHWKEKHFWESVGHPEMNLKEEYSEQEFVGKCGKFHSLIVESEKYGKQVRITDYIVEEPSVKTEKTDDFPDDELTI